ncbi:High-affinity zinc uptake system membrane protein ZnuB [Corynebacterium ciconiae DSM 44920]|uniref:metal ABC transporter permease n=1 Tax=Corynebacterium ciconiae TaxID=227319 RepID=UPI00036FDD2F|nr:metal ABC transporter permease [Corynebacterium ciconiae]WKD60483.1 High-affinity zinc uptake system membrane protein ZnuB [Corynebacterium ciconiae DSM 44920]
MDLSSFVNDTSYLLSVGFVQDALIAAALLGVVSGVMTPLIVLRQMSFSVHGTSELALMGASAALLAGLNIGVGAVVGSVIAAIILALLGMKRQDSAVGVVMSFGMGLSVLFIHLYPGKTSTAFSLLTGQIVGVSSSSLWLLAAVVVIVVGAVVVFWRPLLFASADPQLAAASGINTRLVAVGFAILVGLTAAQSVQIVGALLVMSLLITPGAAAVHITSHPVRAVLYSIVFAEVAAVGGIVLSLAPGLPVSVFVTTLSFLIYLVCRGVGAVRGRRISAAQRPSEPHCNAP